MANLVPADGEKFEWIDDHPRARNIPQAKEDDCIDNYLTIRVGHAYSAVVGPRGKQLTT